jgi:CheY-like chemotaxis protein
LERDPRPAPEAQGRERETGSLGAPDTAPAGPGLREVLCHYRVNDRPRTAVTDRRCTDIFAPMADTEGQAAAPRILVVDDEPSIRLLCRVNLELEGHEVLEADSLATARTAMATGDVDVVLLDIHLHGERSDALLAECHEQEPPIPVVIVSGSADAKQLALLTHADAILPKPFEIDELLSTVRTLAGVQARR